MMPNIAGGIFDKLEDSIEENKTNILVTHFLSNFMWSLPNSNGKYIQDLIKMFDAMMVGHTKPRSPKHARYDNTLSMIASSSYHNSLVNIVCVDNSMISSHVVDASKEENVTITYPIPLSQITNRADFSKNAFSIRALVFSSKPKNLKVIIDNTEYGNLQFESHISQNKSLYILHVNVSNGKNKLCVSGDLKTEIEFFVGEKISYMKSSFEGIFNILTITVVLLVVYLLAL